MDIVVFATQKGGAGKTTLCGQLGVQAEKSGDGPVALLDLDPQSSLADWWNERSKAYDTPALATVDERGLSATLEAIERAGIKIAFIDTPGRADKAIEEVVRKASLAVIPVKPSPHDIRAIEQTIEMIERAGAPMVFVINDAGAGNLTKEAAIVLSQHGRLAPVICRTRQDYRASMVRGLTVMEVSKKPGKSAEEIADLWTYLSKLLKKGRKRG